MGALESAEQTPSRGRVLVFHTVAPPPFIGGAERSVLADIDKLVAAGFDVRLAGLVPKDSQEETFAPSYRFEIARRHIPNIYWPWAEKRPRDFLRRALWQLLDLWNPRAQLLVNRLVREFQPDIVLTQNLRGWSFAPWMAKRGSARLVHFVRDYGLSCVKSTEFRDGQLCGRLCGSCHLRSAVAKTVPQPDAVGGVSRAVLNAQRERGLLRSQPRFVSHPVASLVSPDPQRERDVELGFLGRVGVEKGVDLLIRAAGQTRLKVSIAGPVTSEEKGELAALDTEVNFLGVVDASNFLRRTQVLVVPSLWREPFGRVVLEAAQSGAKVLIADHPGLVEAAKVSGGLWASFRAGDEADLAARLRDIESGLLSWKRSAAPAANSSMVDALIRSRRSE
ncbi:glycosyltransferase [Curtobacterium sp. 260]|uniref:glycosyltransferase n=1 Tax=Curtobacterium sp. 260 TaxID=2817748 RepID=UPI0027806E2C|nr:glycosyltransferase involved in cell wall biosynthesis [Curtobacterium sp. 260]